MEFDEPITALASPPGPGGRGIVRISGTVIRAVIERCFLPTRDREATWKSAERIPGHWSVTDSSVRIPCDLYLWPNRRSYTGQPTAELHFPGSPPVLEKVLTDLHQHGVRAARPGEFTLRAFLAGKIDLVQAEAVLGVIDAQHDSELKTALTQLAGGISSRLSQLRFDLIDLLADLEAGLDFVEEDIEFVSRDELRSRIVTAREFVASLLEQSSSRMTSETLPKVVLAGLPNAGKSTLFNRLAGNPLALVSEQAGTTRDYLRVEIKTDDVTFELIDTAGWETEPDGIGGAAQDQRLDQFQRASLIVWCSASDGDDAERQHDDAAAMRVCVPFLRVWTKCDLNRFPRGGCESSESGVTVRGEHNQGADASRSVELSLSARTGFGCESLIQKIATHLHSPQAKTGVWVGSTAARCRDSLDHAASALERAEHAAETSSTGDELLAVDLREALEHLGTIVGTVYTEDLLDRIFSKFCIGK